MPASRKDIKSPRMHRREHSSPVLADTGFSSCSSTYEYSESDESFMTRSGTPSSMASSVEFPATTTTTSSTASAATGMFTEEQLKLRAMIPSLTPAHGPESTATAILAALSLGSHRPNSHTRRKSEGHVNRPPNAFIVFRRAQVQNMPANVTQHQQRISNLTALFWRVLTHSEQNTWYSLADDIKRLHNILFPDYNFNPRNPDGSKKTTLPRAGMTPERLDFAWNEAQLLIQKHTVMGDHPAAPPAANTGKITRPKAPRKGQGTRAKERREREAAEREASHAARAAAVAAATATAATMMGPGSDQSSVMSDNEDILYTTEHLAGMGGFEHSSASYFATVIEEDEVVVRSGTPECDSAIAWRPDFSLDGSVSSRSSPCNSWTELAPPYEATISSATASSSESVDPLDTSYTTPTTAVAPTYESQGPAIMEEFGHYVASYPTTATPMHTSYPASPITSAHGYLAFDPKHEQAYGAQPIAYAQYSSQGPMHASTVLGQTGYSHHHAHQHQHHGHHVTEMQMVYHDINPTATYLDVSPYDTESAVGYGW